MNVVSLNLSKELDELSGGWGRKLEGANTNEFFWVQDGGDESVAYRHDEWVRNGKYPIICPAYELSYLLRKLYPTGAFVQVEARPDAGNSKYFAMVFHKKTLTREWADTPEDAVATLCCESIRQGVIKP